MVVDIPNYSLAVAISVRENKRKEQYVPCCCYHQYDNWVQGFANTYDSVLNITARDIKIASYVSSALRSLLYITHTVVLLRV